MSEPLYPMNTENSRSMNNWAIRTDGEFKCCVARQMELGKMDEQAIEDVFGNAARILSQCPNPNVENSLAETGLVIGKVQSGKTSNFIAVLALAFDNGYDVSVVLGGKTNDLTSQNADRIRESFNIEDIEKLTILSTGGNKTPVKIDVAEVRHLIETGRKVIIVALKHKLHIQAISSVFEDQYLASKSVIIVDDEGDQATLNTKVYKSEMSKTYEAAMELKGKLKSHCYLSVTATPQANILIQVFDKLSPDFGELVYPGRKYCGLPEFHGQDCSDKRVYVIDEDEPNLLDDSGIPDSVYQAMAMFFVGNAVRHARGDYDKHAMLLHPSQKKIDHEKVRVKVQSILDTWTLQAKTKLAGHSDISYESLKSYLKSAYDKLVSEGVITLPFASLEPIILKRILNCSPVLLCNSNENAANRSKNYKTNIFLGGNLVERGLTLKGLAVTYIIRRARLKSNVDNMEQRARWFGYKADYLDVCKVYTTRRIKEDFESILEHDEDMWEMIERNKMNGVPFKEMPRVFKLKDQMFLRMTRSNVKRTEAFALSLWKAQRYIAESESVANKNKEVVEAFRNKYEDKKRTINSSSTQIHTLYEDVPFQDVFESLLFNFVSNRKEIADLYFWKQLDEAFHKARLLPQIDVIVLRDGLGQTRNTKDDGAINQLFQGRNPNRNSPNYYDGDKSLSNINPDRLQLQIHYVQSKNDVTKAYQSPMVALFIPTNISQKLSDLVVPEREI